MPYPLSLYGAGTVTIGDGISSHGLIDVGSRSFFDVVNEALINFDHLIFLGGKYTVDQGITITGRSGVSIEKRGDAKFTIDHTGEVGFLKFVNCDDTVAVGLRATRNGYVSDQKTFWATGGSNVGFRDCRALHGSGSTNANPLLDGVEYVATTVVESHYGFLMTEIEEPICFNNQVLPYIGTEAFYIVDCNGGTISQNKVNNGFRSDIQELTTIFPFTRPFKGGIYLEDVRFATISNNRLFGLGVPLAQFGQPQLLGDYAIKYQYVDTDKECGHNDIVDNRIEMVASLKRVIIRGMRWGKIARNLIGYAGGDGLSDALGEGGLIIEGASGSSGHVSENLLVFDNDIHNPGKVDTTGGSLTGQACGIYVQQSENITFRGNKLNHLSCYNGLIIEAATCKNIDVDGITVDFRVDGGGNPPDDADCKPVWLKGAVAADGLSVKNVTAWNSGTSTAALTIQDDTSGTKKCVTGIASATLSSGVNVTAPSGESTNNLVTTNYSLTKQS